MHLNVLFMGWETENSEEEPKIVQKWELVIGYASHLLEIIPSIFLRLSGKFLPEISSFFSIETRFINHFSREIEIGLADRP